MQTSQIAHEQKRMERLKAASDKHDQMMQVRESKHIESHRVLGEAKVREKEGISFTASNQLFTY